MPILTYRGKEYSYDVRLSKKAKRMSFVVHWDARCELVVPDGKRGNKWVVAGFIWRHRAWVAKNTSKQKKNSDKIPLHHQGTPTAKVKKDTLEKVRLHLDHYCEEYDFKYSGLKVRAYKTRWGSCSQNHRLAFHYKLSLLPDELIEYVVIHELCHTKHFNHSKQFWGLVGEYCSNYKVKRKNLKKYLV